MNYKNFITNISTTPPPWGLREQICIQDMIDTLVVDTVTDVSAPSLGHHHNKMYNTGNNRILEADASRLGMNCVPSPNWNINAVCVIDLKSVTNSAILTVDNDLMLLNCAIQKDNSLFYRLNNATAPKLFWATGESFIFSLGEIGAINSEFDIDDLTSYGVEYTRTGGAIFNTRGGDFDFTILASSSRIALFADATSASIGIGTDLPLLNIGTVAGDFYVDEGTSGLHIKSRQTTIDDAAFLILEGYGEGANGHADGYNAVKLIMCASHGTIDEKMFLIGSGASFMHFDSLNDDITTKKSNILTLNGVTSNVGIGCEPGYRLDIRTSGTIKQITDIIRISNLTNGVDMDGTGSAILFDLFSYLSTLVHAGRLSVYCEQDMTATASTHDTTMAFATCLNGALTNKIYIDSAGTMGVGIIPWTTWNTVYNALQIGKLGSVFADKAEGAGRVVLAYNLIHDGSPWSTTSVAGDPGSSLHLKGDELYFYNVASQVAGVANLVYRFGITDVGNLVIPTDSSMLMFGANSDVYLTHVRDEGLMISAGFTTVGATLYLGTRETNVVVNNVLGRINFYAPLEADGNDSILPGASIVAIAEDTFSPTVNKTSLVFQTGISEIASTKMILNSAGNLGIGAAAVFDASAVGCLALANATGPAAHTDNQIYVYSADVNCGTTLATLALYTEHAVRSESIAVTNTLPVMINGSPYMLLLGTIPV